MESTTTPLETLIVGVNAFAGFYAAVVWGSFTVVRLRTGQRALGFANLVLAVCAVVAGTYFLMQAIVPSLYLFNLIKWVVAPLLIGPPSFHLIQWRLAREFVDRARSVEEESKRQYDIEMNRQCDG